MYLAEETTANETPSRVGTEGQEANGESFREGERGREGEWARRARRRSRMAARQPDAGSKMHECSTFSQGGSLDC
jgi:hypothetical protein